MSWLPHFTEGDIGNAEVETMGLTEPPLAAPVGCRAPCLVYGEGTVPGVPPEITAVCSYSFATANLIHFMGHYFHYH